MGKFKEKMQGRDTLCLYSSQQLQENLLFDAFVDHLYGQRAAFVGTVPHSLQRKFQKFESTSILSIPTFLEETELKAQKKRNVVAHFDEIPLKSNIFDIVLLYEILEREIELEKVLQEIWRILIPHGVGILIGVNSFGFRNTRHGCKAASLRSKLFFLKSLVKLLQAQGFSVEQHQSFLFHHHPTKVSLFEKLARKWFPFWGRRYFILVRKNVTCLTPMHLSWSLKVLQPQVLPSTSHLTQIPYE